MGCRKEKLSKLLPLGIKETYYLATCNRVEFTFVDDFELSNSRKKDIFFTVYPTWTNEEIDWAIEKAQVFEGSFVLKNLIIVNGNRLAIRIGFQGEFGLYFIEFQALLSAEVYFVAA